MKSIEMMQHTKGEREKGRSPKSISRYEDLLEHSLTIRHTDQSTFRLYHELTIRYLQRIIFRRLILGKKTRRQYFLFLLGEQYIMGKK